MKKSTELKQILSLCRQFGVLKVRVDNIEIEFAQASSVHYSPNQAISPISPPDIPGEPISEDKPPTEDELLYWSSGYDPSDNRDKPAGIGALAEDRLLDPKR